MLEASKCVPAFCEARETMACLRLGGREGVPEPSTQPCTLKVLQEYMTASDVSRVFQQQSRVQQPISAAVLFFKKLPNVVVLVYKEDAGGVNITSPHLRHYERVVYY